MAEGSRYSSYYIKEQTSGVTPSSGTLKVFRATKSGLDIKVATLQSEEIRDDAEVADFRLGARHVEGTATGELSYETFDDLLGGALRGTFAGEVLTAGIERQSFTFIDYNADITDFPYTIYRGCEVNSLAITVSAEAITGVEFGIVGRTMEQAATLPSGLSKGTRTTTPPMDGFSGKLAMGDVSVDVITEMAINLENGIEPRFVVGSKFSIKPSSKRRQISGTLTAYYEDNKLRSKFLNEQESDLTIDILDGTTGAGYRFSMPRIKITEAPRPIDGEGDIMLNMSYTGLLDQEEGYSIRITKLPPISFTTDLTANKTITKGQTLTLSVVVKGGEEPYTYVWKKGGVVIGSANQATYTKSNAQEADAGQYVCEVTDSHGRTIPSTPCLVAVNPGE